MHRIEELTAAVKELTVALLARNQPTEAVKVQKSKPAAAVAATVAADTEKKPDAQQPAATEPVATPPIAEAAAVPEPKAEVSAANDATYDDVRTAFMSLNTAKGRDATVAVLKALGAERVPDIKPGDFSKAVELAKAAL